MTGGLPDRRTVRQAVTRMALVESRVVLPVEALGEDEPLNGPRLAINSLGFMGMMLRLEDELNVMLSDDVFVGRTFTTIGDIIDAVLDGMR